MTQLSQESMDEAERLFCLPMVLLINFALFQYLVTMYYRRRSELRIAVLLFCAFLGFAAMVPLAHPRAATVGHLNDISETCSTLTFLIQITIIGRDVGRKVRIVSLKLLTYVGELLTLFGLFVVALNFVEVLSPSTDISQFDGIDNVMENAGLFFTFFFRFYYIAMSRGVRWMLTTKKVEIFLYALFVTHELPFLALASATGVSWEPVQAIWHRLSLMMCVLMTIHEKLRSSRNTKASKEATTGMSRGPPQELKKPPPSRPSAKSTATTTLSRLNMSSIMPSGMSTRNLSFPRVAVGPRRPEA